MVFLSLGNVNAFSLNYISNFSRGRSKYSLTWPSLCFINRFRTVSVGPENSALKLSRREINLTTKSEKNVEQTDGRHCGGSPEWQPAVSHGHLPPFDLRILRRQLVSPPLPQRTLSRDHQNAGSSSMISMFCSLFSIIKP